MKDIKTSSFSMGTGSEAHWIYSSSLSSWFLFGVPADGPVLDMTLRTSRTVLPFGGPDWAELKPHHTLRSENTGKRCHPKQRTFYSPMPQSRTKASWPSILESHNWVLTVSLKSEALSDRVGEEEPG